VDTTRIGSNRWLGYAPLYLADDQGLTGPANLRLVEYPTATGVLRGFRNGLLDAAMLTLDEALILQDGSRELDLEILLITNVSAGADALYARAPIGRLRDLAGQRIGVENTALGAFFLSRLRDLAPLRLDELSIVSLPVHEHVSAFRDGRIDAVISFASEGPALEALGARRIFDSRELRNEIVDVMVIDRRRVDAQRRERLRALWFDALQAWNDNRETADARLQARLGISTEAMQVTRNGLVMGDAALNREWLEGGQLQRSADQLSDYLAERGLISGTQPPHRLIAACKEPTC
jgi:NitT/TauT family transport system substrate-binding protein